MKLSDKVKEEIESGSAMGQSLPLWVLEGILTLESRLEDSMWTIMHYERCNAFHSELASALE